MIKYTHDELFLILHGMQKKKVFPIDRLHTFY